MGGAVTLVAVPAAELDGYATITAGGEDEQELFEVGAMLLAVPVRDAWRALPADAATVRLAVRAGERNARGDVVQFIELDAELFSGGNHDVGEEGSAITAEEAVQGATERVITDVPRVALR